MKRITYLLIILLLLYSNLVHAGFVASTKIETSTKQVLVEDLIRRDLVTGYDLDSGMYPNLTVQAVKMSKITQLYTITTDRGVIAASADQLLFDVVTKKFIAADSWTPACVFLTSTSELLPTYKIELSTVPPTRCYDLSIDSPHLFFASDAQVLVHNNLAVIATVITAAESIPVIAGWLSTLEQAQLKHAMEEREYPGCGWTRPATPFIVPPEMTANIEQQSQIPAEPVSTTVHQTATPTVNTVSTVKTKETAVESVANSPAKVDTTATSLLPVVSPKPLRLEPILPSSPTTYAQTSPTSGIWQSDNASLSVSINPVDVSDRIYAREKAMERFQAWQAHWLEWKKKCAQDVHWFRNLVTEKAQASEKSFEEILFTDFENFQFAGYQDLLRTSPLFIEGMDELQKIFAKRKPKHTALWGEIRWGSITVGEQFDRVFDERHGYKFFYKHPQVSIYQPNAVQEVSLSKLVDLLGQEAAQRRGTMLEQNRSTIALKSAGENEQSCVYSNDSTEAINVAMLNLINEPESEKGIKDSSSEADTEIPLLVGPEDPNDPEDNSLIKRIKNVFRCAKFIQKKRWAELYEKPGGISEAEQDFHRLNPTNVDIIKNGEGRIGNLSDGRIVNVRVSSTDKGRPTLEIFDSLTKKSIKIRYGN